MASTVSFSPCSRAILNNPDVVGGGAAGFWDPLVGGVWRHDFWGAPLRRQGSHGSWRPLTTISFRWVTHHSPPYPSGESLTTHHHILQVTHSPLTTINSGDSLTTHNHILQVSHPPPYPSGESLTTPPYNSGDSLTTHNHILQVSHPLLTTISFR